uniref:Ubiquitin-like protease family profile domain-containing protein n=1 Tax=Setaria italica TaxID=4555 RepID=K3ZZQ3_SETIT
MDSNIESPSGVDLDDRLLKKSKNRNILESDLLVKIDDIFVKQKELLCLLDQSKYVDDDIQVLDSLCWKFHQDDLTNMVSYYSIYHPLFIILEKQEELIDHNWKNLQVTKWTITEQLEEPIQKDNSSRGLFMVKFMEYRIGETLSHAITHHSRNAEMATKPVQNHGTEKNSNDVVILESQDDRMKSKDLESLSIHEMKSKELESLSYQNKYQSLMSILSTMSAQELLGGLCDYFKLLLLDIFLVFKYNLENLWIQNSKPYSITLTVKKLQQMLNEDVPMNHDCLNLVIRKIMFDNIEIVKKTKGTVSKHCLGMQFWVITDFGQHPNYHKNLDVEWLAKNVRSWPSITYSVSRCKTILMPIEFNGGFILIVLNKDTRTVYILDPTPLNPIYQYNPNARYVNKLLWIAEYLPKAMSKTCPGSIWNEDIFLWRQIIIPDVPIYDRELSGYLVSLFMSAWKDEELQLLVLKLRKRILGQLLIYKDNECKYNMPSGVLGFINCISNIQK